MSENFFLSKDKVKKILADLVEMKAECGGGRAEQKLTLHDKRYPDLEYQLCIVVIDRPQED